MLRASVSLSRRINKNGTSTGYALTLDGEIPFPPNDAEAVLEKVSELFHLAEEALAVEMERDRPDRLGDSHAEESSHSQPSNSSVERHNLHPANQNPTEIATPKQLKYLRNLAERRKLSPELLASLITQLIGISKPLAELTKHEAGAVIGHLTNLEAESKR